MRAVALAEQEVLLPNLPVDADLFGRIVFDHAAGRLGEYFQRRDDNFVMRDSSARYFRSWEQMPAHHRCLLSHARGTVLDLGAGAGQHALALQERGLAVTAIDDSSLAVQVCRERGVRDARVMDAFAMDFPTESFDSVLLMNNNLGIAGTLAGLRQLLTDLHRIVRPGGQILADVADYTSTHEPAHLRYHRLNLQHGRYPGTVRMRIEYRDTCSEFFDWLLIKLSDLKMICAETGWRIARCVQLNAETTYAIGITRL